MPGVPLAMGTIDNFGDPVKVPDPRSQSAADAQNVGVSGQQCPTILIIQGESGTGKEVLVSSYHISPRAQQPFVAINCVRSAGWSSRKRAIRL